MAKFYKKQVAIDAVQLTRDVTIHTLEGDMKGKPTDWLITGVKGEQYPCRDDIFRETYEPADDNGRKYQLRDNVIVDERAAAAIQRIRKVAKPYIHKDYFGKEYEEYETYVKKHIGGSIGDLHINTTLKCSVSNDSIDDFVLELLSDHAYLELNSSNETTIKFLEFLADDYEKSFENLTSVIAGSNDNQYRVHPGNEIPKDSPFYNGTGTPPPEYPKSIS